MEAIQRVRDGVIGQAYLAQSWYTNNRPSIGRGQEAPVPEVARRLHCGLAPARRSARQPWPPLQQPERGLGIVVRRADEVVDRPLRLGEGGRQRKSRISP
jgi:hypothetical protein